MQLNSVFVLLLEDAALPRALPETVICWESIDLLAGPRELTHPNYPPLRPLNHQNQNK